jgi:hypothetical protein
VVLNPFRIVVGDVLVNPQQQQELKDDLVPIFCNMRELSSRLGERNLTGGTLFEKAFATKPTQLARDRDMAHAEAFSKFDDLHLAPLIQYPRDHLDVIFRRLSSMIVPCALKSL